MRSVRCRAPAPAPAGAQPGPRTPGHRTRDLRRAAAAANPAWARVDCRAAAPPRAQHGRRHHCATSGVCGVIACRCYQSGVGVGFGVRAVCSHRCGVDGWKMQHFLDFFFPENSLISTVSAVHVTRRRGAPASAGAAPTRSRKDRCAPRRRGARRPRWRLPHPRPPCRLSILSAPAHGSDLAGWLLVGGWLHS